jgi:hypothetical protein
METKKATIEELKANVEAAPKTFDEVSAAYAEKPSNAKKKVVQSAESGLNDAKKALEEAIASAETPNSNESSSEGITDIAFEDVWDPMTLSKKRVWNDKK